MSISIVRSPSYALSLFRTHSSADKAVRNHTRNKDRTSPSPATARDRRWIYIWKPLPKKEHLFKKHLFTKQLSKLSIRAYIELCRGVGNSYEAAPLYSGNMPGSGLEGEPKEFQEARLAV